MKKIHLILISSLLTLTITGCKKYLDVKSNMASQTPTTVADLQGLLDNYSQMNKDVCSQGSEIASDNYFLSTTSFNALPTQSARNAYLWQSGAFDASAADHDWQSEYEIVFQANVVLDYLPKIAKTASNIDDWNNCKGQALVFRAKSFYEVLQIWSKVYDAKTASTDLGIPIRLSSDFNVTSTRSNIADSYQQVIADLKSAIPLLPTKPVFVFRPSKAAAYGLLARTFLTMGDYKSAQLYSDSCLKINNTLVDYNTLDTTQNYPFNAITYTNPEEIMYSSCRLSNYDLVYLYGRVDTTLFKSYNNNDLRKSVFYKLATDGYRYFRGSYEGTYANFNGVAVDEIYLIKAESEARNGDITNSMNDVNTLLSTRFVKGTFIPFAASNIADALKIVLDERRKELIYRMLRFTDIKRLNRDGANIVLTRKINGATYTLSPNDPKYALPIPQTVLQNSSIQQNPGY